jgi:DNA-binding CsgD family transcriptional regulator
VFDVAARGQRYESAVGTAQRLRRDQIKHGPDVARRLVVSLNTLRTHTRNIYAKLGVNSGRAAVRRAGELNLL